MIHLFENSKNNCLGLEVTQSSYKDYLELVTHAQCAKWICQWSVERLRIDDEEILLKLQTANTQIDQLITTSHDITKSYASDMKIAHVVNSGYQRMFYNTRLCLLDYVVCQLEIRAPKKRDQFYHPLSQDDYLRSID